MFTPLSPARSRATLLALALSVSGVLLGSTILNVALPSLAHALGATLFEQQWILNSYTLTFAGFLLIAGVVGDRFGLTRTLMIGLIGFLVTSAAAALAPNVAVLILARALMGIAAALIMPISLAIILRVFPREARARAISIWAASSVLAISAGPLIGGALLSAGFWWGSVLVFVAVLAAVALAVSARAIPRIPGSGVGELRWVPVIASVAGIALLVFGVLNGGQDGWTSPLTLGPLALGILIVAVLVWTERRHPRALVDVALFRHPGFGIATLALTVGSFVLFGYLYFIMFYLSEERGLSPFASGLVLLPLSAALVIGAPLSRLIAERIGMLMTLTSGLLLMALALGGHIFLSADTPIPSLMGLAFVLQFGFALVLTPGTAGATTGVPADRAGAASALLNTLRQLGSALGVAVLGSLLWGIYAAGVRPVAGALSASARDAVEGSLSAALSTGVSEISMAATRAFLDGLHLSVLVAAVVSLLAGVLTLTAWLRRRGTRRTA
ncbi:MFS transporter [Mycetocola sp. JXN-3]|uniref:MFS transporter n=1 Tax=Mycetocola sp. JXN-3 TaxID=2116510 RepID=UPI00165D16F2|nr:MFS transporter [Mycetocola sp. JXN-3]